MVKVYALILGDNYWYMLFSPFVMANLYVWAKYEPQMEIRIYMFPVSSGNLPWALVVLHLLLGADIFSDLIGIAAGHTFVFLKVILPRSHGYTLLYTPKILEYYVEKAITYRNGRARVNNLQGGVRIDNNDGAQQ